MWIGPKPAPSRLMQTWKDKHPDFEYILWNESELAKREMKFVCQKQIEAMGEINGKADIFRWEILYQMGGYFVDADSFCIEPFDSWFEGKTAFACYENENTRKDLIATVAMGFVPGHPMCRDIIQWMSQTEEAQQLIQTTRAWYSVGPGLITRMLDTGKYTDVTIYPSHYFVPSHFTGELYMGHKRVYATQEWGTGKQCYDNMNDLVLPEVFQPPTTEYSVLITSYNTKIAYIRECLESIRRQIGHFAIEVIWVDDGSTKENSAELLKELRLFEQTSRFVRFIYLKNEENVGPAKASNRGLKACSNEIVFKMDSDDIMMPERMATQITFMTTHPGAVLCGANSRFFKMDGSTRVFVNDTRHMPEISWEDLYHKKPTWIMNHPTFCFRKSAILSIGGYNEKGIHVIDDYELLVRLLHQLSFNMPPLGAEMNGLDRLLCASSMRKGVKTDGVLYNIPDVLLLQRMHPDQMTEKYANRYNETVRLQMDILQQVADGTYV